MQEEENNLGGGCELPNRSNSAQNAAPVPAVPRPEVLHESQPSRLGVDELQGAVNLQATPIVNDPEIELEQNIARVDTLKAELDKLRPLSHELQKKLLDEFCVRYTYDSNAIEGNSLSLKETELVLLRGVTIGGKPLKDHQEVQGHRDAFYQMVQMADNKTPLTKESIIDLHSLVLAGSLEQTGSYRRGGVIVTNSTEYPPHFEFVPQLMDDLLEYMPASPIHPIEKIAYFHLDFERTHPFFDGNGRTGRLLMNLQLMQHGYAPINIKYADVDRYYLCFKDYFATHRANILVNLIAEYLSAEIKLWINAFIQTTR